MNELINLRKRKINNILSLNFKWLKYLKQIKMLNTTNHDL